jgi:hypothetical protein
MDLVTEIQERVANDPKNEGVAHSLLSRAAGEISRLRSVYEKDGVVDPWTGTWCPDGKYPVPDATHDQHGRLVAADAVHPETGAKVVPTHAVTASGIYVPVQPPLPPGPAPHYVDGVPVASEPVAPTTRGWEGWPATSPVAPSPRDQTVESHERYPNPQGGHPTGTDRA